jgi:hypothetical protein
MKKNLFVFPVLFCLMFVLTACPDPNINSQEPEQKTNPDDLLSPDEQKNFLVEVAEELIATFNPADQKAAVDLADDLYYKYQNYDWNSIEDEFAEEWDEFYSAEFDAFFGMPKKVIDVFNGRKKVQDLEILLTLSKIGRVIELDDKNKTVKITKSNDASITVKFSDSKGVACEAKVWGEGKEISASYTYEDYYYDYENGRISDGMRTIKVKVPTTINMYLRHGSNSLVSMNFTWDSNLKDYVNTSLDLKIINLGFQEETKVTTTAASAVFSFTYDDNNLITAAANLPKYKLIGWEGGKDITEEEGENWIDEYEDKYASLLGKVGKGEAKLDILGKIQIQGGVTDGAALLDAYYNWNDTYYRNSLDEYQDLCEMLNNYLFLSVYYNKTTTEQAKLQMQVYEDYYGYDIEPVMYFPYNNTSIAIMTYFNSSKFLGLADLIEDLANSYIALDKNNILDLGEVEFDF